MFDKLLKIRIIAAAAALMLVSLSAAPASAQCGPFPKVSWWKNLNHESVARYVDSKHSGNWAPYIAKWQRQKEKLEDIADEGKSVIIKSMQIRLKEQKLKEYIGQVDKRIAVTQCLQGKAADMQVKESQPLEQFGLAGEVAGGAADDGYFGQTGSPLHAINDGHYPRHML